MEQDKILTHVYVVEVKSKQQDKDNSNDVCNIHSGVLRVFANKEDASAYMREYYDKCELTSKSIETYESGNGGFSIKVYTISGNIPDSVSMSGEKLENRICLTNIRCYTTEITTNFDKEKISVEDDYDEFFG